MGEGRDYTYVPHITGTSQIPGTEKASNEYLFHELMLNFLKILLDHVGKTYFLLVCNVN